MVSKWLIAIVLLVTAMPVQSVSAAGGERLRDTLG